MVRVDVHQHVWGESLARALAERTRAPRLRRDGGTWMLEITGEAASPLPAGGVGDRIGQLDEDGVDVALVALSAVAGVEALPDDESRVLLAAHDTDVDELGTRLRGWGSVPLRAPRAADVDRLLDRGRIGLCLPSGALTSPAALDHVEPLLEALERRDAPLFVHPGPSPWDAAGDDPATPGWWPALTDYVTSMHRAWHAWMVAGRVFHPRLRVVFAMLAGGAPLHLERLAARAGEPVANTFARDPHVFYDTSSYGPVVVDTVQRLVGSDALVHGSDRPVIAPAGLDGLTRRRLIDNPARLLGVESLRDSIGGPLREPPGGHANTPEVIA